jgi:hypothetical protein
MTLENLRPRNWPLVIKFILYPVILLLWLWALSVTFFLFGEKSDVTIVIGVAALGLLVYLLWTYAILPAVKQIRKWADGDDD